MSQPSPPRLSLREQQEFEDLVREAAAPASAQSAPEAVHVDKGDELHPNARRPAVPEFEGDVNPVTGERGGPKREPVRHGDWSFGGRVSDF